MKLAHSLYFQRNSLILAAAITFTTFVHAQVVNIDNQSLHYGTLLTDNFNTPSYNWWEFNNFIASDQGGSMAALSYSTSNGDGYTAQHSNGGRMLLTSNGWGGYGAMASPNRNFAADVNATNKPLEIQFDMWAIDGDPSNWIGFGLGSGQGSLFFEGAYGFAATIRDGAHNLKFVISDTAGTGSGFNGITDGAKIDIYRDNVFLQTIIETLGTSDGYMTFRTIPSAWGGWTIGHVDNLKISSGPLVNPLATSSELNLSNNGSINFGDVTQTVTKLDGTAGTSVKLANSSLTVDASTDSAFSGVISGNAGSLDKKGAGKLTLRSVNTFTGGTTVSAGTLELSGANNGNAIVRGSLVVQPGATVNLTNDDGTGLGWVDGSKVTSLTINGGMVTSTGTMHVWNFPGGVNMTGGTLQSNGGTSDANGSQLEWINANVTTYASANTATIGGRIRMRGDGGAAGITFTVADGDAVNDLVVSAAINEAWTPGRTITKNGPGTMVLSGANSYTGATTVNGGKLVMSGTGNYTGTIQVNSGILSLSNPVIDNNTSVVIASGAKVDLNFVGTEIVGSLAIDGGASLPAGIYDSNHPDYGSYFTGTGSITILGANSSWVSLADGNWSDSINWSGGTPAVGYDATATFNAAVGVTVNVDSSRKIGNLIFDVSDYTLNGSGSLLLEGSITPSINVASGRVATIGSNLSGSSGLEKTGDGKLVLTGMKSYTGGTLVTGGTLELAGANSGNAQIHGSLLIGPGATVAFTGGDGTGFGYLNSPVTWTTINGGTINAVGGSHIGFGSYMTVILENGGSIQGNWQWNGDSLLGFSSSGDNTNTIGGNLVLRADAGVNHTFVVNDGSAVTDLQINANLSDQFPNPNAWWITPSGLTKSGTGIMVMNGTNTYDGNTVVSDGRLEVTQTSSLRFRPTTNGATNSVSGSATSSLSYLGVVDLDLSVANATVGNTWNLFNLGSFSANLPLLNPSAVNSGIGNFSEVTPGVWELPAGGAKWVFTESNGNLSYLNAATDFDTWKLANGVTGEMADDDDGDGLNNYNEYAFGLDPTGASSLNPIAAPLNKTTGQFSYTRRTGSLTGLTYTVWVSTDLTSWSADNGAVQAEPVVNGDVETVAVTLSPSLLTNSKLFMQVRAN